MPMKGNYSDLEECLNEKEQLYMMEVMIDKVDVVEDRATIGPDLVLPALVNIKFADFPVMQLERNQFLLPEKMKSDEPGVTKVSHKIIKGLPDSWPVTRQGDTYLIEIPNSNKPPIEVPKSVVTSDEGLNFILAAVKGRGDNGFYTYVEKQIKEELTHMRESGGGEGKVITEHKFSSGKSCLFHMTPFELISHLEEHPLKVQVYRCGAEGGEFVHVLIGEARVPLGSSFSKAVLLANTPVLLPVATHVENSYPLADVFGQEAGSICVYVRLSCFGSSVFREEETDEMKKQRFLQSLLGQDRTPYYTYSGDVDMRYPWKKNLNAVEDKPAPKPRLQPMYEPLPPPPPQPLPPLDMGEYFPDLPRCSPYTQAPCYRRSGDRPFTRCSRDIEAQLMREEHTRYAQTDPIASNSPYGEQGWSNAQSNYQQELQNNCTCPTVPPELIEQQQQQANQSDMQCTCAALMKSLIADQKPQVNAATRPFNQPEQSKNTPAFQQTALDNSNYEITLTKTECGLEDKKEDTKKPSNYEVNKVQPEKITPTKKDEELRSENKTESEQPENPKEKNNVPKSNETDKEKEKEQREKTFVMKDKMEYDIGLEYDDEETDYFKFKKGKKKFVSQYEKTAGMYPGHHVGHKHCVTPKKGVPKSMGWLWTDVNFYGKSKNPRGWRPGSIRSDVTSMLDSLRVDDEDSKGSEMEPQGAGGIKPRRRHFRPSSGRSPVKQAESVKHNPTLHVHKKGGLYYVSMIPVRTQSQEDAGEDPEPIQFKIDPKHPDGIEEGESCDGSSSSTSSSSVKSYEMNFVAPIALQTRKKRVEKLPEGTQYNEQDFAKKLAKKKVEPEPPKPPPKEDKKCKKTKEKGKGKGKKK